MPDWVKFTAPNGDPIIIDAHQVVGIVVPKAELQAIGGNTAIFCTGLNTVVAEPPEVVCTLLEIENVRAYMPAEEAPTLVDVSGNSLSPGGVRSRGKVLRLAH